eukprot:7191501-Prymnesium_polylepis.1
MEPTTSVREPVANKRIESSSEAHPYAQAPCSHANAPTSQHAPPSPRDVGDPATDEHAAHAQCDAPLRQPTSTAAAETQPLPPPQTT